jgi:hypothetical protein
LMMGNLGWSGNLGFQVNQKKSSTNGGTHLEVRNHHYNPSNS